MSDQLLIHLVELQGELDENDIPLIVGGGMSIYLRHTYVRTQQSHRYPFNLEIRSTNDIDLFLTSELIVDRDKVEKLKNALHTLGYQVVPEARNFQFSKSVNLYGQARDITVDLLSAPPEQADLNIVHIKKPRIRPENVSGIHAYLTEEAAGINIGIVEIDASQFSSNSNMKSDKIYIPSAYNYIILKLNAFDDRKDKSDDKSDFGRHHAYDIFATVTRMNEEDWKIAKEHFKLHSYKKYLKKTCEIQARCFSKTSDIGLIRLRENTAYKNRKDEFDSYIEQFLGDLKDLFRSPQ